MTFRFLTPVRLYYSKILLITAALLLLLLKSEQHYSNLLMIIALLCAGYYLGKLTCSVHLKNTGIGITILVFVLMNMAHSFIDGISFTGQSLYYWLGAVGGHELIRQPTLYVVLWAILQPVESDNFAKVMICFVCITVVWVIGIWLGEISGASVSRIYNVTGWVGYSIFLFIGDIVHHLIDQYGMIRQKR